MKEAEMARRAKAFTEAQLDLEAAERELAVAKDRVEARREDMGKARSSLLCEPLKNRTTTVLLTHPYREEGQVVVVIHHEHHHRDGDLWTAAVHEISATDRDTEDEL